MSSSSCPYGDEDMDVPSPKVSLTLSNGSSTSITRIVDDEVEMRGVANSSS
jgi:hypothetical protein